MAIAQNGLERALDLLLADMDFVAVGTGANTPLISDTQLQEEVRRDSVVNVFRQGNVVYVKALIPNTGLPAITREVGLFLDATSSPNNGDMLVRSLNQFIKGSADLVVTFEITLSEA
jgi:hypothetical protein